MKEIFCTVIFAGLLVSVVSGYMIEKDRREYLDHWSNPDRVRERTQQSQATQSPQWADESMVTAGERKHVSKF